MNNFIKRRLSFFNRIKVVVIVLLLTLVFNSQAIFSQAYNFKNISIHNGLPQSQAYALSFDKFQRAWIGTQGGGLCIYDGTDFIYITKNDSLISNRVFCIYRDSSEKIFVGTRGGISVFNHQGKFIENYWSDFQSITIHDILLHKDKMYIATDKGLHYLKEKKIVPLNEGDDNIFLCSKFFIDETGNIWVCSSKGLLDIENPFNKLNKARGLPVDQVETVLRFGDLWLIGTYGGGLVTYSKKEGVSALQNELFSSDEIVTALHQTSENEIWIGTQNNGVFVYDLNDKNFKNYRSTNGLANNNVRFISTDKWNNIWIGTSGGGISIFQNSPFIKYSYESGLNGNYIYSVASDGNNTIWASTEGRGVVRINDTSSVVFDEEYGFLSEKIRSIFIDNQGDVWFATEGKGLGIYSPSLSKDTVIIHNRNSGLSSDWIKGFAQNKNAGEIYIATVNGGILKVNKTTDFPFQLNARKLKISEGKLPDRVNTIFFHKNELWFTGNENIFGKIDGNKVDTYLIPDAIIRNAVSVNNSIWIGTMDNGICRINLSQDSVYVDKWYGTSQGLASNNIYQLLFDNKYLWVGSEKGLDRILLSENDSVLSIEHFGTAEGFDGLETNADAGYFDRSGNIWFGTVDGLFKYQGGEINKSQTNAPELRLIDFRIFYESIESTEYASFFEEGKMLKNLILPYDKNHIGFSFKAVHFTHADNIRYQWILEGVDKDWSPPSKVHEVPYGNLSPGKYRFKVKAFVEENKYSEIKEVTFQIDYPYWEKWWFKLLYFGLGILIIMTIFLIVLKRQKLKSKRLREKLELEKNMLELEQKALRLQMNPHFIFNVLNSIHNLIILNDQDKARYALAKFSKLMRRVLENSREKLISIDDEKETLENYLQLERLTSGLDIEMEFNVDDSIDSSEQILPPLMIQPFVENAVIHGFKNSDRKGVLKIEFKMYSHNVIQCSIIDNGVGRVAAGENKAQKENYHRSTALTVTQERLNSMNKNSNYKSFEIIDLKDENNSPCGTKIIIRFEI